MPSVTSDLLQVVGGARRFQRDNVEVVLDGCAGSELSQEDLKSCVELMRENMRLLRTCTSGAKGTWDDASEKEFVTRLTDPASRVLIVRGANSTAATSEDEEVEEDEWVLVQGLEGVEGEDELVDGRTAPRNLGFLHVQASAEGAPPALVVLDMQLVPEMRGRGVGKYAMEVVKSIATKLGRDLVIFNRFKANAKAMQQWKQQQQSR
jgi:GNAT superfamily N-acetyltransferase